VTQENFMLAHAADLVALCSAQPNDPLYTPAANFCHGFVVGTYHALEEVEPALPGRAKLFCGPPRLPSRNEAVAAFVTWAAARPDMATLSATDGFTAYLEQTYPCP
jgi:predicted lipoprotein